MKPLEALEIKRGLLYTKGHLWAEKRDRIVRVGVSDYAQSALGEVVYVELPPVGTPVSAGAAFGSVESVKAVNDLESPVTGTVAGVNEALSESPDRINSSPYGEGWLLDIEAAAPEELGALWDGDAYASFLRTIRAEE
jgi:glycine cleavage system H protein